MAKVKEVWRKLNDFELFSIIVALIIMCIFFTTQSEFFFTLGNILNILQYASCTGLLACSMTYLIAAGGTDISIGSAMAISICFMSKYMPADNSVAPALFAMILCVVFSCLCGLFNGFMVSVIGIAPFVATMATMNVYRGGAYLITNGQSSPMINKFFAIIGRGKIGAIEFPVSIILWVIFIIVFWFIGKYTIFGRRIYIIGGNRTAAHLAGIKVNKNTFALYGIHGAMVGVAAVVNSSQLGAALPQGNMNIAFEAISGVVLGGVSMAGGKGSVIGSIIGVIFMATLNNGMVMMNINANWQMVALGVVLILAVCLDLYRQSRNRLK